jgi:hypothetical protein
VEPVVEDLFTSPLIVAEIENLIDRADEGLTFEMKVPATR